MYKYPNAVNKIVSRVRPNHIVTSSLIEITIFGANERMSHFGGTSTGQK